jgi:hypothetical protein
MTEDEGREMQQRANDKRPAGREGAVSLHIGQPVTDSVDDGRVKARLFGD